MSPAKSGLTVRGLVTEFATDAGPIRPVNDVALAISPGRTLGLVGESGSGKSLTALSIMRLVAAPGQIVSGTIELDGRDLLSLSENAMRSVRGDRIAMIFQEPMTSLNPVLPIGEQVAEALRQHRGLARPAAHAAAIELLAKVGMPSPGERVGAYPHQLSGGMRQRVMIAMALACRPDLLIADEPTTALDVTIQAQILDLLRTLQGETGMAMLLITHDLGVVTEACDDVALMYAGQIVEVAPTHELLESPRHPYAAGLLGAMPGDLTSDLPNDPLDDQAQPRRPARLVEIPGTVPSLANLPAGCAFAPRCQYRQARCDAEAPSLTAIGHRSVRCHFPLAPS